MTVFLLTDKLARRKELATYLKKKEELEWRLNLLRQEIRVTDDILKLIKRELA